VVTGLPLVAGTAAGVSDARAGQALRRVGIIGGGMAGVSLAWLLNGERDVVLLEARDTVGGNVRSVDVDLDGHQLVVDMGAQFFHPGPYPTYTALLTLLGLYPPGPSAPSHSFPASITVAAQGEATPRFLSPILPDRSWPLLASWNQAGIGAFAVAFPAAKLREQLQGSWSLTLEDWLQTLGLTQHQREAVLLPWAASLFSGSIDHARGLSARAAMIFAAKALPPNPLDPVVYYVLNDGMTAAIDTMLSQCTTVEVMTGASVSHVVRGTLSGFTIHCADGRTAVVDDLVFAASGPATHQILQSLAGTELQRAALQAIEFHDAQLALHTDPIYAPPNPFFWSFLNCQAQGAFCEASMWLGPVITVPGGPPFTTTGKLWKSWITHRAQAPSQVLHEVSFKHMLPTPSTLAAQAALRLMQGRDGLWFAGGYMRPYDAQETALLSALGVALGLHTTTPQSRTLSAAATAPA
jgi:predicted NAD/FAD-binding protein